MFDHWLRPVTADLADPAQFEPHQFGRQLAIFTEGRLPSLREGQLAIIGIGDKEADAVRRELYAMSFPFQELPVADLGNIRRKSVSFILHPIRELFESRIFPVIIGGDPSFILAQYQAFLSLQQLISLVLIDERIRLSHEPISDEQYYLNKIVYEKQSKLFHLGFIGAQTHYTDPASFRFLEEQAFDCVRLGRARSAIAELEPIIRDGDLLSLNLAALKQMEAPAVADPTPSGFFVEEACQISRYGGMSDKLKSFGIYGYRHSLDRRRQTARAIAQILWYFIDGYYHRKQDYPVSTEGLTEYIVEFKKMDYQLTFWKSQKSGRWWMQVPVKTTEPYQRHRLIPCSYNDYKLACQEELPERLLNAYKRFA